SAVFEALDIGDFTIHLNHRKMLRGYFEGQGIADEAQVPVLREIDKLDKRGEDAVRATLAGEGFGLSHEVIDRLMAFSRVRSSGHDDALARLEALGAGTPLFEEGREELREVLRRLRALGVPESRYAINLSSHYTRSKLPGVGISIGLTRLFWQLREAGLVQTADSSVDVLVTLFDDGGLDHALGLSQQLRAAGLNVETQLEPRKLGKQMQ